MPIRKALSALRRGLRWEHGVLVLLVLLSCASLLHWLHIRGAPYSTINNEVIYLEVADQIYGAIGTGPTLRLLRIPDHTAPLPSWMAALLWKLFGRTYRNAVLVNLLFTPILVLSTYRMARELCTSRSALLAAFLVSAFPLMYTMQRYFLMDYALSALVALGGALYLTSRDFTRPLPTLTLGLVVGLISLTKLTAWAFIIGPALYALARARRYRPRKGILIVSVLAGATLSMLWYAPNWMDIIGFARTATGDFQFFERPSSFVQQMLFYPKGLVFGELTPLVTLIAAFLVLRLLTKRKLPAFLSMWTVSSLAILTLVGPQWWRYSLPILPAIATIIACGVDSVPGRWGMLLAAALPLYLGALFCTLSFGVGLSGGFPMVDSKDFRLYSVSAVPFGPPEHEQNFRIVSAISKVVEPDAEVSILWMNPERVRILPDDLHHVASFMDELQRARSIVFDRYPSCQRNEHQEKSYVLTVGRNSLMEEGATSSNESMEGCFPDDLTCLRELKRGFLSGRGNRSAILEILLDDSQVAELFLCS